MVTKLLEGHSRFRREYFEHERELFETLATGAQRPNAMMLTCCDSRVVQRALDENRVEIHGWVYDLATATVRAYAPEANEFRPVTVP